MTDHADIPDPADAPPAPIAPPRADDDTPSGERDVWVGRPSQWTNFPIFVLCAALSPLILPILYAAWVVLETRMSVYTLTTERLRTRRGVLAQRRDELELYRVRDIAVRQSFWQRLVGVGSVELVTSDRSDPRLVLPSIPDFEHAATLLREHTERMRRVKRVRELDVE
jgi:uncharacterized membrane protein YdbT with pleckstrin-like domain